MVRDFGGAGNSSASTMCRVGAASWARNVIRPTVRRHARTAPKWLSSSRLLARLFFVTIAGNLNFIMLEYTKKMENNTGWVTSAPSKNMIQMAVIEGPPWQQGREHRSSNEGHESIVAPRANLAPLPRGSPNLSIVRESWIYYYLTCICFFLCICVRACM